MLIIAFTMKLLWVVISLGLMLLINWGLKKFLKREQPRITLAFFLGMVVYFTVEELFLFL